MPNTEHNITSSGAAAPTALGRSKTDPSQSNYTEGAELRRSQSEVSSKSFMDIAYSTLEQLLILHKRLTPEMALRVAEVVVAEQDLLSENRKRKASAEKRFTVKLSEAVSTAFQAIASALENIKMASDQLQENKEFYDMLKLTATKIARDGATGTALTEEMNTQANETLKQLLELYGRLTPALALHEAKVTVAKQDLLSDKAMLEASAEKRFTVKLSEAVSTAIQAIAAALGPRNMTIASDQLQKHNDFRDMLKKKTVKIARNEVSKKKKVKGGGRTRKNLKKKRKRKSRHTRKNKRRKTKRKRVLKRKSRRN